jgi:hypothetical protein
MKLSNFKLRQEKGVAGTTVLLGLIVSLFVIGLLVMIFALMGGALQTSSYTTKAVVNESDLNGALVSANTSTYTLADFTDGVAGTFTVTSVWAEYFQSNGSAGVSETTGGYNVSLAAANYSLNSNIGNLTNGSASVYKFPNVSVSYTYSSPNTATNVIGNTTSSISGVTNFFSLFIVIGSMVVLILLTVIIIVAIRQSGLLDDGTA